MLRYPSQLPPQEAEGEANDDPERVQKDWAASYKAYIKKNGAQLCALAWRGYEREGRGAIVAKQREQEPVPQAGDGSVEKFEGVASAMYVSLARWTESVEAAAAMDGDVGLTSGALRLILDRVLNYDPREDFVVVYETPKLCGADIVRPSVTPPIMAERLMPEEGGDGRDGGAINVTGQAVAEGE